MKQVYIAQPMTNLAREDILAIRFLAEKVLRKNNGDVKVINPYRVEWESIDPMDAVIKSLDILKTADVAFFVEGWKNSNGCRLENLFCDIYEIPWGVISKDALYEAAIEYICGLRYNKTH